MHSDPIADMLTRIRNGCQARHRFVRVPYSKRKAKLAKVLQQEGFIDGAVEEGAGTFSEHYLVLTMRYDEKKIPVICAIKRVSKPGLRRYFRCDAIPKVRAGLGVVILTTSKGMMTDRDARRARLGGEALCIVQ